MGAGSIRCAQPPVQATQALRLLSPPPFMWPFRQALFSQINGNALERPGHFSPPGRLKLSHPVFEPAPVPSLPPKATPGLCAAGDTHGGRDAPGGPSGEESSCARGLRSRCPALGARQRWGVVGRGGEGLLGGTRASRGRGWGPPDTRAHKGRPPIVPEVPGLRRGDRGAGTRMPQTRSAACPPLPPAQVSRPAGRFHRGTCGARPHLRRCWAAFRSRPSEGRDPGGTALTTGGRPEPTGPSAAGRLPGAAHFTSDPRRWSAGTGAVGRASRHCEGSCPCSPRSGPGAGGAQGPCPRGRSPLTGLHAGAGGTAQGRVWRPSRGRRGDTVLRPQHVPGCTGPVLLGPGGPGAAWMGGAPPLSGSRRLEQAARCLEPPVRPGPWDGGPWAGSRSAVRVGRLRLQEQWLRGRVVPLRPCARGRRGQLRWVQTGRTLSPAARRSSAAVLGDPRGPGTAAASWDRR